MRISDFCDESETTPRTQLLTGCYAFARWYMQTQSIQSGKARTVFLAQGCLRLYREHQQGGTTLIPVAVADGRAGEKGAPLAASAC